MADTIRFDGLNPITQVNQANCGAVYVILKHWEERKAPELRAGPWWPGSRQELAAEITERWPWSSSRRRSRGWGPPAGFEFLIEDREGRGVQGLADVSRPIHGRRRASGPNCPDCTPPSRSGCPSSDSSSTGARRGTLTSRSRRCSRRFRFTWAATTSTTSIASARPGGSTSSPRARSPPGPERHPRALKVLNYRGERVPLSALGEIKTIVGPIDVPHYNLYNAAKITGNPCPGYSSGQAIQAMQEIAAEVLPDGFGYEWTGSTYQELKTGNQATFIFALSIICVFLFMAALYESWIRPMVIILTVPLATFGAIVGLWIFNLPLDVFGQIGLVMLIGLETKNAILVVEFGVELMKKEGMSIIDSAKEAVAAAAAADPHDLVRLHHGRLAHGPRHRGRRLQPQLAGHRHRLGHAHQHHPGPVRDPGLLRARRADHPLFLATASRPESAGTGR